MAANQAKGPADVLNQAMDNYFNAMKTGVKLQEDVADWWTEQGKGMASADAWSKPWQENVEATMSKMQLNFDEAMALMERNTKDAMALLNKAGEVASAGNVEESREKLEELWDASLEAVRKNAQLNVDANARMMEAYSEFIKKTTAKATAATAANQ